MFNFFTQQVIAPFFVSDLLLAVLLFPLLSFFFLLRGSSWSVKAQYKYALLLSSISFILSRALAGVLNFGKGGFQETFYFSLIPSFTFALRLGVDGISLFFILLTNLFIFLCILSLTPATFRLHEAILYLVFLQWSVLATFLFLDLLGFFVFFERTLIPIYFLVLL